ncbi:peroxide stress protein YaaA [Burkholderiaceae bacterium DAT-1]|nr:peroxide stress protein YaaA [Burkholderiaceae bacterium DAT-1]
MLFVISPAKTLDYASAIPAIESTLPDFISQSAELIDVLRKVSPHALAKLMDISDELSALNVARYAAWSPEFNDENSRAAVYAFMGDVYEGLDVRSLDHDQIAYLQTHLRILSGLYGILRPLDRMQPYRLEMGTRLNTAHGTNLYAFWGMRVTDTLNALQANSSAPVLVNLASEEYFKVVSHKKIRGRVIDCVFEDFKNGKYKIISFFAKRARGLMVRYAALNSVTDPEKLKDFDLDGYRFDPEASSADRWVFRRNAATTLS